MPVHTIYSVAGLLFLAAAFAVFRVLVRRDYRQRGRLAPLTGLLELLVWGLFVCFPYIYNPPTWWFPWFVETPAEGALRLVGLAFTTGGILLAIAAMAGLGMDTTMGQTTHGLKETGLYRFSRNPQIVAGGLMVAGIVVLWPSWYALGWALLYGVVGHMMVLAEEEHLLRAYGEPYLRYCQRVPRYLGLPGQA